MALTKKEIQEIKKALDKSARPLFFFDDDPDGVCSFAQLYRYKGDGKGVILKVASKLSEDFVRKVDEYQPDLVVILDVPEVSQDFLDKVKQKVIWLDHHPPQKMKKVKYYNPRLHDDEDNRPTAYWAYQVVKKDLWLAMTGCVGDWFLPDFKNKFIDKYKGYLKKSVKKPDDALFESKVGLLARIISFNLKGTVSDSMKSIKTLTRIEHPDEILKQTTPRGRFLYKKYERQNVEYQSLLKSVKAGKDKLLVFTYPDNKTSFTSELSNELLHKYPDKVLIIGRKKDGDVRCSIRGGDTKVLPILKKALKVAEGYGGGHDYASGASVKEKDFKKFVDVFKKELS